MTDWFWNRLSIYFGWLTTIILFILIIFAANIEIKDLDLWLHLASGRFILENAQIPHVDIFSATVLGKPWINHEWLFQIVVYSVYNLDGIDGLITLQVMLVGITFLLLLFLGYNRDRQVMPIITLLLVVLVYQIRFYLRPDIFSLLFFVLYICILSMKLSRRSSVIVLFFLQVLWTNIHGFFILGPFLIVLNIMAEWIKRRIYLPFEMNDVGRLSDDEYRRLKQILIVVICACFFNPYFIKGALYPLKILFSLGADSKIFFLHIGELFRPFTLASFFNLEHFLFYKMLLLISALSFALNYRRIDIGLFLFWLFFLIFSFSAVRNVPYFAFVAYFVILANSQHIHASQFLAPKFDTIRFKSLSSVTIKVCIIFFMIQYMQARAIRGYYDFDQYVRKSEHGGLSLRNYPSKAVDFLINNAIEGRFFNDFNSGAYLIGRASPNIKVFIDGRTELYGGEFFRNYKKIWKGDTKLFDEFADKYQLTGAFLNSVYVAAPEKTIRHLYESREWQLVYFDYDAAIFLRDVDINKRWIRKNKIDLTKYKTPKADLLKIKSSNVTPYRYTNRAQTLLNLRQYKQAKREAEEALNISPSDAKSYKIMGIVALKEKDYQKALVWMRNAKVLNPKDIQTRFYLAKALYHAGEYNTAQREVGRVLEANPRNHLGILLLSRIYEKQGNSSQAQALLDTARNLAPEEIDKVMKEFE